MRKFLFFSRGHNILTCGNETLTHGHEISKPWSTGNKRNVKQQRDNPDISLQRYNHKQMHGQREIREKKEEEKKKEKSKHESRRRNHH